MIERCHKLDLPHDLVELLCRRGRSVHLDRALDAVEREALVDLGVGTLSEAGAAFDRSIGDLELDPEVDSAC